MDKVTELLKEHHTKLFAEHGATARGVDWNDEREMLFRYEKMLAVLDMDFFAPTKTPTLLDVGCGWGGLYKYAREHAIELEYTGIDVVESMVTYGRETHAGAKFVHGDVMTFHQRYDFVVCNAILTQKLTASNVEMDRFAKKLVTKMFELCNHGIAFNLMSNQVNFTVPNLFYKSPLEMFAFCIGELSPRVRLDHGYSSLASGKGKLYDFTVYVYKD